ncbi:hypothetical protein HYX01_01120 [Candidatus Woesearchaeota archaeon]|nr:hypothetical protein [Candidatus Woesearchaeota archaeon]
MKLLKTILILAVFLFGIITILASLSYLSFDNAQNNKIHVKDSLKVYKENVCTDNPSNITCKENMYVECNGKKYEAPIITGYTVKEKVFVPEYVKIGCTQPTIIVEEKKLKGEEIASPYDRIKEEDVSTFSDFIKIDLKNAKWRKYIDSNSMDPLIDKAATTIEIKPEKMEDIHIGDIISYNVKDYDYSLVHRVVDIKEDENGIYFVTKGDNYWKEDQYKIRFSQVEGVIVGILY